MIQANEFRLGNLVCGLLDVDQISKICYIDEQDFGFERLSDKEYFQGNSILPIPLTEEILLKCGFERYNYSEYKKDRYIIENEYTDKGIYNFVIDVTTILDIDLMYVHQLQNLWFALTGKELNIEL